MDMVFDDVDVIHDVPYGANFSVLAISVIGHTLKEPLLMDVYTPAGDTETNRPLAIVLHTGNFLPIMVNGGVTGTKTDSSTVEICKRLARMGYVVASADYRKGWNPFAETQPERTVGLINAAYRGVQDARSCVRYFKQDFAINGNSYGIDTTKIVMWGQGTGGYIALAAATLDDFTDVITTTMPPGKFLIDVNGTPTPMVSEQLNGNLHATNLAIWPDGVAPFPGGDTMSIPNNVGYGSDFQLCVNVGGALGDIDWLDDTSPPFICFQVPTETNAPYNSFILGVPSPVGVLQIVEVQGSFQVATKANQLSLNDVFVSVEDEPEEWAKSASALASVDGVIGHDYLEGLFPFNKETPNAFGQVDGSPWQWWEKDIWDTIPHPLAGTVLPAGSSFHFSAMLSNPDMSSEKGRAYIDTIMAYYAPRAFLALGLQGSTTEVTTLDKADVGLSIAPNPSSGVFEIKTAPSAPMQEIRIYDMQGKLVIKHANLNHHDFQIRHDGVAPGLYITKIRFEKGEVSEKIILK
jgi:hypothetical protein